MHHLYTPDFRTVVTRRIYVTISLRRCEIDLLTYGVSLYLPCIYGSDSGYGRESVGEIQKAIAHRIGRLFAPTHVCASPVPMGPSKANCLDT